MQKHGIKRVDTLCLLQYAKHDSQDNRHNTEITYNIAAQDQNCPVLELMIELGTYDSDLMHKILPRCRRCCHRLTAEVDQ